MAEQLVGRAEELGVLDHALSELERGRARALELVGEPGIGKTWLLAELGERADSRAQIVLSGSAAELEADLPFWIFVDALDEYLHGLEPPGPSSSWWWASLVDIEGERAVKGLSASPSRG